MHHTNHGTSCAAFVMCIPSRNLEGPHLPRFSVLPAFKKILIVVYRDAILNLQTTVLQVSKYPFICCFIVAFLKLCKIVDANINKVKYRKVKNVFLDHTVSLW